MTVTVYLKDLDKDNNKTCVKMEPRSMRQAEKIFNGLMRQWNSRKKGVVIPGYGVAIASDRIHSIIFNKDESREE